MDDKPRNPLYEILDAVSNIDAQSQLKEISILPRILTNINENTRLKTGSIWISWKNKDVSDNNTAKFINSSNKVVYFGNPPCNSVSLSQTARKMPLTPSDGATFELHD